MLSAYSAFAGIAMLFVRNRRRSFYGKLVLGDTFVGGGKYRKDIIGLNAFSAQADLPVA